MVRVLVNQSIHARIVIERVWADKMRACEFVPEMPVHRIDEKQFAVLVPVMAPWICRAGAERLDHFSGRMIPPDRAAQGDPLLGGRARHSHLAGAGGAAAAIKPAVRAESQSVR